MANIEQMAGKDKLVFTARGEKYETGPVTMWHIATGRRLLEELVGPDALKDPSVDLSVQAMGVTLTQLFEDAGHIVEDPEEPLTWRQMVKRVTNLFGADDMLAAGEVIQASMPKTIERTSKLLSQIRDAGADLRPQPAPAAVSAVASTAETMYLHDGFGMENLAGLRQYIPADVMD